MNPSLWHEAIQLTNGYSTLEGTEVHDFEEYTFHAPRPGFFLGDSLLTSNGSPNPVALHEQHIASSNIPSGRSIRPFLGNLDVLPTELLWQILRHLDVCSVLAFRRINQHAKDIVDNFSSFRSISSFPKLLGASEALQCRYHTIETLAQSVLDERCSECGNFGDLLYLVDPRRWCYPCWIRSDDLAVKRCRQSMMDEEWVRFALKEVPHAVLSDGYFGRRGRVPSTGQQIVFDMRRLRQLIPESAYWPGQPGRLTSSGRFLKRGHALRYTTVIRAPYWDSQTSSYEEGFFCSACASQGWLFRRRDRISVFQCEDIPIWGIPWRRYTRTGMKKHIENHGRIYKIRTEEEEERYLHEKPFALSIREEPGELSEISEFLRRCRLKELEFDQGQPFLCTWREVSSKWKVKEASQVSERVPEAT